MNVIELRDLCNQIILKNKGNIKVCFEENTKESIDKILRIN
jgi:hypothetical protein